MGISCRQEVNSLKADAYDYLPAEKIASQIGVPTALCRSYAQEMTLLTYIDPQHVAETLATGPCNAHISGNLMILTFTTIRPDPKQLFDDTTNPELNSIVVARIAVPLEGAPQIARIIIDLLTKANPTVRGTIE
jgi:hypothetical protein